jgi:hypothetical protein
VLSPCDGCAGNLLVPVGVARIIISGDLSRWVVSDMRVGNELLDDVPDGVTSVAMTLTWFMDVRSACKQLLGKLLPDW